MQPNNTFLARGGSAHAPKMILAHFNKTELDDLDNFQGHSSRDSNTGYREYKRLDDMLSNPYIIAHIENHVRGKRRYRAMGGSMDGSSDMASMGRNGDNEMALITPQTSNVLNNLAGSESINPHTNHPEYFNLSGSFGGLGDSFRSGMGSLKSGMSEAANSFGSGMSSLGSGMSSAYNEAKPYAQSFSDAAAPHIKSFTHQMAPHLAQGLGNAMQNWGQGQDFGSALGQGMRGGFQSGMQSMGNNENIPGWMRGGAQVANGMMNAQSRGQDMGGAFRQQMAQQMTPMMNYGMNQMEQRGVPQWAQQGFQGLGNAAQQGLTGGDWRGALRQGGANAFGAGMNQMQGQMPQQFQGMMQGFNQAGQSGMRGQGDWRQGLSQGFGGAMSGMQQSMPQMPEWAHQGMNQGRQVAQNMFDTGMGGGNWQQAGRQGLGQMGYNAMNNYMPQRQMQGYGQGGYGQGGYG